MRNYKPLSREPWHPPSEKPITRTEPRIRGYSEQLSNPFALTPELDDVVTFKKSSDENSNGQMIARRQKLLQLSKAVVMRIRELGLK